MSNTSTPRKTRSQGPAEAIDLDHPNGIKHSSGSLDVEKEVSSQIFVAASCVLWQMAFYASYHSNKINKIIHFIFIPQILWSAIVILSFVPLPGVPPKSLGPYFVFQPSLGLLLIASFASYYLVLEPFAGITYLPVAVLFYLTAAWVRHNPQPWMPFSDPSHPSSAPFAWIVFVGSWIAQFIGHGVFEKRAPALLENLVQALVTAPFFVHLEFLSLIFDYRPELFKRIKSASGLRIRDMNRAAKLK